MDLEQFKDDMSFGADMAGVAQRREANQLLREQAELEKKTQTQNAQILRHLKEQEQKEEAEKKRLASLPSCPDCKLRVEVGSRRCAHCHIEIVSWDYTEQGLSWRLICRKSEAGALLQQRRNFLVAEASRFKTLCVEACSRYDAKLTKRCCDGVATVSAIIARQKTQSSRNAISQCVANRISGKPILTSKAQVSFDAERDYIIETWKPLHDKFNSEVSKARMQLSELKPPGHDSGYGRIMSVIAFVLIFTAIVGLNDPVKRSRLGGVYAICLFAGAAGFFSIPIKSWMSKIKAERTLTAARVALGKCNSEKNAKIADLNTRIDAEVAQYSDKLTKAGVLPLVDELLHVRENIAAARADLNTRSAELKRFYTAALAVEAFAETCDNVKMKTLTRLETVESCCAGSNVRLSQHEASLVVTSKPLRANPVWKNC